MITSNFVDQMLDQAEGAAIFGKPVMNLTRDEAIACLIHAYGQIRHLQQRHQQDLDTLAPPSRKRGPRYQAGPLGELTK